MFSIEMVRVGNRLEVALSGRLDSESDRLIDQRIVDECRRSGCDRVLVDIRDMLGRLSVSENLDAASTFHERLGNAVARIAIVDDRGSVVGNRLFESQARGLGAAVRFFANPAGARAWLDAEPG